MPRFADAVPILLGAGSGPARGGPTTPREPGSFAALLASFLNQKGDDRAVESGLTFLRDHGWLDPTILGAVDPDEFEDAWRSTGPRSLLKLVRTVLKLAAWTATTFDLGPDGEITTSDATESLRDGLRAIHGIGPATADALLLEGLGRAAYPLDRATYRVLVRHGWLDDTASYDEARARVEAEAPDDPRVMVALSLGFAEIGRLFCRATVAKCDRCPLRPFLPEGGPLGDS